MRDGADWGWLCYGLYYYDAMRVGVLVLLGVEVDACRS